MRPTVSVVIPTLNEERNLPHVFSRIPEDVHEVIIVDGRSADRTVEVARELRPDVRIVAQTRKGKGNALACGFEAATGDVIVMVDADGSADPLEIPRFVDALIAGADFAKGTRFSSGGGSADITRLRRLGNWALTGLFNACYGQAYSDLCYGYNAFWRRHVPVLGLDVSGPALGGKDQHERAQPERAQPERALWGDGFEVETLIHVRAALAGLKVAEVPSFEHPRIHGASNLNAVRDGLRVVRTIVAERGGPGKPGSDGHGPSQHGPSQHGPGQHGPGGHTPGKHASARHGGPRTTPRETGPVRVPEQRLPADDLPERDLPERDLPGQRLPRPGRPQAGYSQAGYSRTGRPRVMVVGAGWRFASGISHYTYRLATELSGECEVSALLMRRLVPERLYPGAARVGANVTSARYGDDITVYDGVDWYWGGSMHKALDFVDQQRPDIVILQWWTGAVLHSYLRLARHAARSGARVILEWHEGQDVGEAELPGARRYVRALMPHLLSAVSAHVVHSEFDQRALRASYPLGPAPVRVIQHGPYDHLARPVIGDRQAPGQPLRLLYLGVVRPYKGVSDLVEAFSGLPRQEAERFRLSIVGETWEGCTGPDEAIAASPHADLITRVDRYVTDDELARHFADADAVVLPYHRSSASGPLQIAMSAGLPVIVTAVGGLIEAVRGYPGAILVPPRDPVSIRKALPALLERRGHRYPDPHSWETAVREYQSLAAELAGTGMSGTSLPGTSLPGTGLPGSGPAPGIPPYAAETA